MVNYFRQPYNPNRIPMQNNEHLMNQDNKIYWIIGIFILLLMGVLVYIIFVSPFQKDDSLKTDKGDIRHSFPSKLPKFQSRVRYGIVS